MTGDLNTALVGHIIDVQGTTLTASLIDSDEDEPTAVTIGKTDILVGQLGSYVVVRQGDVDLIGMVTRMSERERLVVAETDPSVSDALADRTLTITPLGSLASDGTFERHVRVYPTTGAEVHAILLSDVQGMFTPATGPSLELGALVTAPDVPVGLKVNALYGHHFAILGQTGFGKSWTVASLLQRTVSDLPGAHFVLLDIHGEYRTAFRGDQARVIDATELEIPYWLMTLAELSDLLVDRSEQTAHNQIAFFRDTLIRLRESEAETLGLERATADTPIYFSLDDLRATINAANEDRVTGASGREIAGPLNGQFTRFLIRLDSRTNDIRYDFLLKPKIRTSSDTLPSLLADTVGIGGDPRPITVIDLSTIPSDVRPTVTAQIARLIFEFNYWNPKYRQFPIVLVCDEAHAYIRRDHDSQYDGAREAMERIAKEGRKYGIGIGVVSQRPHELSETVLSQCGTFICLRITNPEDQAYVRRIVPEAQRDLIDILSGLGRGEALILGDGVELPVRVAIALPDPTPNSDDPDFAHEWRTTEHEIDTVEIVDRWRNQKSARASD